MSSGRGSPRIDGAIAATRRPDNAASLADGDRSACPPICAFAVQSMCATSIRLGR
jgi:hypothetical protein